MSSPVAQIAEVCWGYTMADIDRLAWHAVGKHSFSNLLDNEDRYACAWHAIVVELFTRTGPPHGGELIRAAFDGLNNELVQYRRANGQPGDGVGVRPNFVKYWHTGRQKHRSDDGFSDRLCDYLALKDALSVLTAREYEAIATLAAYDNDGKAAADALGLNYETFKSRLHQGRKRIVAVWFGDETPARLESAATCRAGHLRAEHWLQRTDGRGGFCGQCRRINGRKDQRRRREAARTAGFVA